MFLQTPVAENSTATNKIEFVTAKEFELGTGSGSTVVYKGTFGRVDVAVKKISNYQHHNEAENEIKFLVSGSGHLNIVRYYTYEKHDDVYFLALELCHKNTLKDWIAAPNCLGVDIDSLEILWQTTEGLDFLHEKKT